MVYAEFVEKEIERIRFEQGLGALARSVDLDHAAQQMANDIARSGDLDHVDSQGQTLAQRLDGNHYTNRRYWSENLAIRVTSADQCVTMWMESGGHRRNILAAEAWELGIGVASVRGGYVVVADFGARYDCGVLAVGRQKGIATLYCYGTAAVGEVRFRVKKGSWTAWQSIAGPVKLGHTWGSTDVEVRTSNSSWMLSERS